MHYAGPRRGRRCATYLRGPRSTRTRRPGSPARPPSRTHVSLAGAGVHHRGDEGPVQSRREKGASALVPIEHIHCRPGPEAYSPPGGRAGTYRARARQHTLNIRRQGQARLRQRAPRGPPGEGRVNQCSAACAGARPTETPRYLPPKPRLKPPRPSPFDLGPEYYLVHFHV